MKKYTFCWPISWNLGYAIVCNTKTNFDIYAMSGFILNFWLHFEILVSSGIRYYDDGCDDMANDIKFNLHTQFRRISSDYIIISYNLINYIKLNELNVMQARHAHETSSNTILVIGWLFSGLSSISVFIIYKMGSCIEDIFYT